MKKLVAMLLSITLALTACGGSSSAPADSSKPADAASGASSTAAPADPGKEVKINFGTGGTTGTYYAYGGVLANILSAELEGVTINVQSTGASKANILQVEDKEADMAIVQNDVMYYAYNGTDLFSDVGAVKGFSALGAVYAETCQIISVGEIKTIEDLKGKRISVGDAGSGVEFNARQILEAYGIKFEDIKVNNLSFGDSADAIKDGKIDAFFCTAGAPTTAIVELATTKGINVLAVDDAHAKILMEKYPFYTQFAIPGGSYKGVDKDVMTVSVKATLIVSNDLPEDVVYRMTKTMFDKKAAISESHAKGAELDPAYAVAGISVPFHPGAQKYYKEAGVL